MKKLITLMIAALLQVVIFIPASAEEDNEFSLAVNWASENRIITPDPNGQFENPNDTASRAQAAAMLARLKGIKSHGDGIVYSDVAESDWYYYDVCAVSSAGIMTGDSGLFRPNDCITREEAVVLAGRAFDIDTDKQTDTVFSDGSGISDWAKDYVYSAAALGIVNGTESGDFLPHDEIKRSDLLLILYRCSNVSKTAVIKDDDGSIWTPLY